MRGQLRRALQGAVQLHGFGLTGAEPAIRVAAAGQFIEHAGQGVNIRRGGQLATVEQLQCGITRRPGGEARAAQAWQTGQQPFQRLSEPIVEQAQAVIGEHHVARLQVAMQHAQAV